MWPPHPPCALRTSVLLAVLRAASTRASAETSASSLARAIYDLSTPPQVVVFATGGGVQLTTYLLGTPGASRSMLDVQLPYSRASLTQLLGAEPKRFVTPAVLDKI